MAPPAATVGPTYAAVIAAQKAHPGRVGAVNLAPGDHQYWNFWVEYHLQPGPVTVYGLPPDAAADGCLYIVVVSTTANPPVAPPGYGKLAEQQAAGQVVSAFIRRAS